MRKLLILFLPLFASAQTYFPMREGAVLEYRYYNDKGKALRDAWRNERFTRLMVEKMWGDSIANVAIENETFERLKGDYYLGDIIDATSYGDVVVREGEVLFENVMWTFIPWELDTCDRSPESLKTNFEVAMSSTARLPRVLNIGDSLPEVRYKAIFTERVSPEELSKRKNREPGEFEMMLTEQGTKFNLSPTERVEENGVVRGRRVVGHETVGRYDCFKIEYELVGPAISSSTRPSSVSFIDGVASVDYDYPAPMVIKYADYISPEVGLVRREKMNGTGRRVEEIMQLESVI